MPTIVSQDSASTNANILVLGGTSEASALAAGLARDGMHATLSYAGRVANPRPQPVQVRVGGFGGVAGLAAYLREQRITHLIDATHPFAATIAANAVTAAEMAAIAHIKLVRPAWQAGMGDDWRTAPDLAAAIDALAGPALGVMLALGRMHVDAFAERPQHRYLLRFVDAPRDPPRLPHHHVVVDRGPFDVAGDSALMRTHAIDLVVCKNAGGSGAEAKLIAARALGLPVLMIDRPPLPACEKVASVAEVLDWIDHSADRGV